MLTNASLLLLVAVVAFSFAALWRIAPRTRWQVRRLVRESHALLAKKQYSTSLELSQAAALLAGEQLGESSRAHVHALLLVAAVNSVMGQPEAALRSLDEAEEAICRAHGKQSLLLLPVLYARAEVLTATARAPLAIEALDRARELLRSQRGKRGMEYATSCYRQASAIVRHAKDSPQMEPAQRAVLVERAVGLVLDASAAATASFDAHEGDEFAEALLDEIQAGGGDEDTPGAAPNRLASLPACDPSIRRLREHLQDHFEHFGGEEHRQ